MVQGLNRMEEKLWDIGEVKIDKELPIEDKLQNFPNYMKEGHLTHTNEGYVVRVHFGKEDYSATDAVKHYLKQIAQLKY